MRILAYVDAMYRPTDKLCGYGFLVEQMEGGVAVPILMGNQFLPYAKQGSAQTEIMAIEDFLATFATTLKKRPSCLYTDCAGILNHLRHNRVRVSWMRRDSEQMQMAHMMAQKLRHMSSPIEQPVLQLT